MSSKHAYQRKLKAHLDKWKASIEMLEAEDSRTSAHSKGGHAERLRDLKSKCEAAEAKLVALRRLHISA